jgi:hypothetical protein
MAAIRAGVPRPGIIAMQRSEASENVVVTVPTPIYRFRLFPMPRETFNVIIYSFLGLFKVLFLVFNVVPYLALLIVGKRVSDKA